MSALHSATTKIVMALHFTNKISSSTIIKFVLHFYMNSFQNSSPPLSQCKLFDYFNQC